MRLWNGRGIRNGAPCRIGVRRIRFERWRSLARFRNPHRERTGRPNGVRCAKTRRLSPTGQQAWTAPGTQPSGCVSCLLFSPVDGHSMRPNPRPVSVGLLLVRPAVMSAPVPATAAVTAVRVASCLSTVLGWHRPSVSPPIRASTRPGVSTARFILPVMAMTRQRVHALIKANRSFDLILAPNRPHSLDEPYIIRGRWDYCVTHLPGAVAPDNHLIARPVDAAGGDGQPPCEAQVIPPC